VFGFPYLHPCLTFFDPFQLTLAASSSSSPSSSSAKGPQSEPPKEPEKSSPSSESSQTAGSPTDKPLTPAVLRLISLHHLDPSKIPATGPKNRLLKGDVLKFLEQGPAKSAPPPKKEAEKLTKDEKKAPSKPEGPKSEAPSRGGKVETFFVFCFLFFVFSFLFFRNFILLRSSTDYHSIPIAALL